MALKRQHKTLSMFSMASMTDVIFLLLIFFLVTSTFVFPSALEVNLPQSSEQTAIKPSTRIYVDKDLNMYATQTTETGESDLLPIAPEQLEGFMKNNLAIVNYEREEHGQKKVSYKDFWTKTTDSEGNAVYQASWTGPEPEMKIEPSDRARFANYTLTYDAVNQVVVCTVEAGGGIG